MKVRSYVILERAIEEGIVRGWQHAHKCNDKPDVEMIKGAILQDVMSKVYEVFNFDDDDVPMCEGGGSDQSTTFYVSDA